MEYDFELKFKLAPGEARARELVERLGEAGCDDAVIGIGQPGRIALNFTRDATSAKRAVVSALRDVKKVIPRATLIETGPDFVSLTDIADRVGVSRQNMRKLMLAYSDSFPAPIHEGSTAFWHLAPVLQWLERQQGYSIEPALLDVAHIAMQINLAKEAGRLEVRFQNEVRALVA